MKPYVKGNKTDRADAEAICEAARRPGMRFIGVKSVEQQELQFLHRVRSRNIGHRTALSNEIRGFLREYGIALPRGISQIRRLLEVLERHSEQITPIGEKMFRDLYEEFVEVDARVKRYDRELKAIAHEHPVCRRLMAIEGIGPVIATCLVSAVGNAAEFKNGRGFSSWLGLVPRQHSSGDNRNLGRISKRGDTYLRQLMIHGARAVVRRTRDKEDKRSNWINNLIERRGFNKAVVAVANKNARVAWVLMAKDKSYRPWMAAA